jgi:hypothetical protein
MFNNLFDFDGSNEIEDELNLEKLEDLEGSIHV